ncbi:MAG: dTDP-4-dehydrorhamnose reductase [Pseudomonadota bacterium]|jgi:dTDP-4-dehydrorhamnose reductase
MSRTILVIGRNGQLGWELRRALLPLGRIVAPPRAQLDLAQPESLRALLRELKPDVVVNPAAYTAVDQAEREPERAFTVNAEAPRVLAQETAARGALLIHYSTDYVFDGAKPAPYDEDDAPAPLNVYGRSKLAGEEAIREAAGDYLIFRTSWVYAARGRNFLRTVLRLARERDELRIVADQVGAPTWARLLAEATALALRQAADERRRGGFASGVFHLTTQGETSWYGFAQALLEEARRLSPAGDIRCGSIVPIRTTEYPLPAARPLNSRLATARVSARFGLTLPHWHECLKLCLEECYGMEQQP